MTAAALGWLLLRVLLRVAAAQLLVPERIVAIGFLILAVVVATRDGRGTA